MDLDRFPPEMHARFPTVFRGEELVVILSAKREEGAFLITAEFTKDGRPFRVPYLTRKELGVLCREAGDIVRNNETPS